MIAIYPPVEYQCPVRRATPQTTTNKSLIRLDLMATIRDSSESKVEYSTNPIEQGRMITDHARILPVVITADIIIPDDPGLYLTFGEQELVRQENYSFVVYQFLKQLQREFAKLEIITNDGIFENMFITDIVTNRTVETGNTFAFSITFAEKEFSYSAIGEAYAPEEAATQKQVRGKDKKGQTNKTDEKGDQEIDNNTVAGDIYQAAWR